VVARLVTTNPRPKDAQRAMAEEIHSALRAAIEAEPLQYWWQCCVLIEPFDKGRLCED
jgi:5-carboxymethyl-2-hydroxymuconate isomerase